MLGFKVCGFCLSCCCCEVGHLCEHRTYRSRRVTRRCRKTLLCGQGLCLFPSQMAQVPGPPSLIARSPRCAAPSAPGNSSTSKTRSDAPQLRQGLPPCGSFRKLGVPYFGVLMIRILLFRVLYLGPYFRKLPCHSRQPERGTQIAGFN